MIFSRFACPVISIGTFYSYRAACPLPKPRACLYQPDPDSLHPVKVKTKMLPTACSARFPGVHLVMSKFCWLFTYGGISSYDAEFGDGARRRSLKLQDQSPQYRRFQTLCPVSILNIPPSSASVCPIRSTLHKDRAGGRRPVMSQTCHVSLSATLRLRATNPYIRLCHPRTRRCPRIDGSYRTTTCCSGQHLFSSRRSGWGSEVVLRKG